MPQLEVLVTGLSMMWNKLSGWIRKRLVVKIFLTYLVVMLVGIFVLASTAELIAPGSYDRHMAEMEAVMTSGHTMMGDLPRNPTVDLHDRFKTAMDEALIFAIVISLVIALTLSVLVSRRIVHPIQDMMEATKRIAAGNYQERVLLQGNSPDQVDELGQLAINFNRMSASLNRTEERRRQLIGDIAHELRTPLTTIKGSMEAIMDGVIEADDNTLQHVYKETIRLERLVEDLSELSQVEAGELQLIQKPIRLKTIVDAVLQRLKIQFEQKGVECLSEIPEGLPLILADEDRIKQVLINLIGNGLQYTQPGGSVSITATHNQAFIQMDIHDTGIGLSPESIPHVFTRFFRVDKSRSRAGGGSGLGLTIAKHLVELHGGRIWVESAGIGFGSTFHFTLPISSEYYGD